MLCNLIPHEDTILNTFTSSVVQQLTIRKYAMRSVGGKCVTIRNIL